MAELKTAVQKRKFKFFVRYRHGTEQVFEIEAESVAAATLKFPENVVFWKLLEGSE